MTQESKTRIERLFVVTPAADRTRITNLTRLTSQISFEGGEGVLELLDQAGREDFRSIHEAQVRPNPLESLRVNAHTLADPRDGEYDRLLFLLGQEFACRFEVLARNCSAGSRLSHLGFRCSSLPGSTAYWTLDHSKTLPLWYRLFLATKSISKTAVRLQRKKAGRSQANVELSTGRRALSITPMLLRSSGKRTRLRVAF